MALKFGIRLRQVEPIRKIVELAQEAEEAGFDHLWLSDSQAIFKELYVTLTAIALNTHRIGIGPIATNPRTRHPTVTAAAMAAVDELAPGRTILSLSPGGSANRAVGWKPSTVKECKEAIETIREFWSGNTLRFGDQQTKFRWPGRRIPIYFTSSGPRMLAMAAGLVDGVNLSAGAFAAGVRHKMEYVRRAAADANRKPADLQIGCEVSCCLSNNPEIARQLIKPIIVNMGAGSAELFELAGIALDQEQFREVHATQSDLLHSDRWDDAVAASACVTEEMVDKLVLAGKPEDCIPKLKALEAEGVHHIDIRPFFSSSDPSRLEFSQSYLIRSVGEKIIPHFR